MGVNWIRQDWKMASVGNRRVRALTAQNNKCQRQCGRNATAFQRIANGGLNSQTVAGYPGVLGWHITSLSTWQQKAGEQILGVQS